MTFKLRAEGIQVNVGSIEKLECLRWGSQSYSLKEGNLAHVVLHVPFPWKLQQNTHHDTPRRI
jgi:hypothetical protein